MLKIFFHAAGTLLSFQNTELYRHMDREVWEAMMGWTCS